MEYILVTGYAGYIGSHVCKELKQQGYGVVGVDTTEPDRWNLYAKYVDQQYEYSFDRAAISRIIQKHNIKTVVHTAATSLVGPSMKDPDSYYRNNVDSMHVFLNLCRDSGVKRIVYSSSAAVYGDSPVDFVEDMCTRPVSPYGKSKLIGEFLLQDYCHAYGMSAVALRYFNVCGADSESEFGQVSKPSHIIAVGITRAIQNQSIVINGNDFNTEDGTCERDYIHVTDVARANVAAVSASTQDFIALNIGNSQGFSNLSIVNAINQYTKYSLPYQFGPSRSGDPARLVCNNSLAKSVLNWKPMHSELKTIIETAAAWHENNTV